MRENPRRFVVVVAPRSLTRKGSKEPPNQDRLWLPKQKKNERKREKNTKIDEFLQKYAKKRAHFQRSL